MLTYPKMIIFDYGHTLLYEPGFDTLNGEKALFKFIKDNPNNVTPEQANDFSVKLFAELDTARKAGFEIHECQALRYKTEYFGLEYTVSIEEAEIILWNGISEGAVKPGVFDMLSYLDTHGIRSAIISNIGFSGNALTERINRLLPQNNFEFIIASSEYAFRKPNPRIFELALQKAGLSAKDVWYRGDDAQADIEGAASAGIYPVWYDNDTGKPQGYRVVKEIPKCEHLYINDWYEMLSLLDKLYNQ